MAKLFFCISFCKISSCESDITDVSGAQIPHFRLNILGSVRNTGKRDLTNNKYFKKF